MSILKDVALWLFMGGLALATLAFVDQAGFKRGKAAMELEWQEAEAKRTQTQLDRVESLSQENAAITAAGIERAAEADRLLAQQFADTRSNLEKLRAQTIPIEVGADCRRSFDAVRLYDQAAVRTHRDREGASYPASPSAVDDPLSTPGAP